MCLHSLKQWFSKHEEHYPQLNNGIKGYYIDGVLYQNFYKTFDEDFSRSAYPQSRDTSEDTSVKEEIQRELQD